ncbi:MAG: LemA family protein [Bauldia litoralis]
MTALWIVLAVAAALAAWVVWAFNRLVRHRNLVREAWGGIDVQLRRRHDLVPNLIGLAEAYRVHENTVLTETADSRARSMAAAGIDARARAEAELGRALSQFFAVAENYPDLKADSVYLRLQAALRDIEDHLQMARRYYNGTVRNLNNIVEMVPTSLVAGAFGFRQAEFFELDDAAARSAPQVA